MITTITTYNAIIFHFDVFAELCAIDCFKVIIPSPP